MDVEVLAGQSLHTDANAVIALLAICLKLDEHHDHHHLTITFTITITITVIVNYLKARMQLFNI